MNSYGSLPILLWSSTGLTKAIHFFAAQWHSLKKIFMIFLNKSSFMTTCFLINIDIFVIHFPVFY